MVGGSRRKPKCSNCRLRKIRCDEARPACIRCVDYGLICSYAAGSASMNTAIDSLVMLSIKKDVEITPRILRHQLRKAVASEIVPAMSLDQIQDLERIQFFQQNTVGTMCSKTLATEFFSDIVALAWSRPYLMHAILAITAAHINHLSGRCNKSLLAVQSYHLNHAARLTRIEVTKQLDEQDRDAIWATSIFLSATTAATLDAAFTDSPWPLSHSAGALDWLKLSYSELALCPIVPHRFPRPYLDDTRCDEESVSLQDPQRLKGISRLVERLQQLCVHHNGAFIVTSPYSTFLSKLVPLLYVDVGRSSLLAFLRAFRSLDVDFSQLLIERDARALLLFSILYARLTRYEWWMARRAKIEGQAIRTYLKKYHASERAVIDCLETAQTLFHSEHERGELELLPS